LLLPILEEHEVDDQTDSELIDEDAHVKDKNGIVSIILELNIIEDLYPTIELLVNVIIEDEEQKVKGEQ